MVTSQGGWHAFPLLLQSAVLYESTFYVAYRPDIPKSDGFVVGARRKDYRVGSPGNGRDTGEVAFKGVH